MAYTPTTWVTGDTVTATKMNKLEQGVANAGGGKYDVYDYIIKQVDSNTPTLEKGSWQDVYNALQDMEPIMGLFIKNLTPGQYHDTVSLFIPITYTCYYSSADLIFCRATTTDTSSSLRKLSIDWESNGTIDIAFVSI